MSQPFPYRDIQLPLERLRDPGRRKNPPGEFHSVPERATYAFPRTLSLRAAKLALPGVLKCDRPLKFERSTQFLPTRRSKRWWERENPEPLNAALHWG